MNQVNISSMAAAVCAIGDERGRQRVCQIIGQAHALGQPFFDWGRWREACNVPATAGAPPPHLAEPTGDGFVPIATHDTADHTYLRSLADAIASLNTQQERARVCELIGAVCAQANPFFDTEGWTRACQAHQQEERTLVPAAHS